MSLMKKIAIIGSQGVGKTTFCNNLQNKAWDPRWISVESFDPETLKRNPNTSKFTIGNIEYTEFHGNYDYSSVSYTDFINKFDLVIILFDCGSKLSLEFAIKLSQNITSKFMFIGNKHDIENKQVKEDICFKYMSLKTSENVDEIKLQIQSL